LHAKGKLYRGTFTATPEAAQLSRAAHLGGTAVPALIRFSSGSGNPAQPDNAPGVRGMAVKFTLPDGSTTDVSTQTAKLFPASTPDDFISLLRAMRPGATAPLRLVGYIATHPRFLAALPVVREANKVPASYGTVAYHGLHAFRWVAADGSARFVRYHLLPDAGEQFLSADVAKTKSADFLIDELDERLTSSPVRFAYQVQVAAEGDSPVDPSRPWHSTQTVTVGTIDITGVETQRERGGDIVVFDPMRVTDGIEPSDDPVLRFRTLVYSASVKLRTGVDRGPEAPAT
jgi:catalase